MELFISEFENINISESVLIQNFYGILGNVKQLAEKIWLLRDVLVCERCVLVHGSKTRSGHKKRLLKSVQM